jgi:hypothetical protein
MTQLSFYDRVKVLTPTVGAGSLSLANASGGFRTFTAAGVPDQTSVRYVIEDGNAWEVGVGVYSASGSLSRNPIESSNSGNPIMCSGMATVSITLAAADVAIASVLEPLLAGLGAAGLSGFYAREDHQHPSELATSPLTDALVSLFGTLPTTLPSVPDILWNNSGSLAISAISIVGGGGNAAMVANLLAMFPTLPTTMPTTAGTVWCDGNLLALSSTAFTPGAVAIDAATLSASLTSIFPTLPTSLPSAPGVLWNDSKTLAISSLEYTPGSASAPAAAMASSLAAMFLTLPTSLPGTAGVLWNDGNTLAIS